MKIFVFIATQLEDTIFNLVFMEEKSHKGQEGVGPMKAIMRLCVRCWVVVLYPPSQCLY